MLNLYTSTTIRNMIFSAQHRSLADKAQLMTTALLQVDDLTAPQAKQAVNSLDDLHTTRTVVTDASGVALYDSLEVGNAEGRLLLFPEIASALNGNDAFYSCYADEAIESRSAMPIMRGGQILGAVYLMEYDTDQGQLIAVLQRNVLRISIALEAGIILISFLFSAVFSRRMQQILQSVRSMRDGDYSAKVKLRGHDELNRLGREFNELSERLDTSEQKRRQFVSDASHELKTPLASIKLLSDSILQNEMDIQTEREFISDIGREADRLGRLTQKLLTLTKLDSALDEDREIIDAVPTVQKVIRMLRPLANLKEITMECTWEKDCTLITVEDDLYQIVFNLTENAIKYNREKGWVGVTLSKTDSEVVLKIADHGVGIPEESMEHIFDRFYRVDKARSRAAGGAGLGLSIVRDMVERNYGTIGAAANEGGGTVITVTFPLFESKASEEEEE